MSENKLLTVILPSHPDLFTILSSIRSQYSIPEFDPSDPELAAFLLSDSEIPWEEIRAEIRTRILDHPDLFPPSLHPFINLIATGNNPADTLTELARNLDMGVSRKLCKRLIGSSGLAALKVNGHIDT